MLLRVDDLVVTYRGASRPFARRRHLTAVDHVSFSIGEGQTLGLVGESGSGKSSTGNAVLGLTAVTSGSIRYAGTELATARRYPADVRRNIQAVFQNPGASLDPAMLVGQILAEPLDIHGTADRAERRDRVREALELVGLDAEHADRSPHEFSGGQRQRIAIARALILEPKLLVLDEAVSALDASTQSQIINLLEELQKRLGLAYLFISHDLSVVHHVSDRIAVMYGGHLVEHGPAEAVFADPAHPYTRALLDAVPRLRPRRSAAPPPASPAIALPRTAPDELVGCPFARRCPHVHDRCRRERPPVREVATSHWAACVLHDEPRRTGA